MRRGETDSVMLSASTSVLTVLMVAGSFHFWHSGDLCPTFLQSQHLPFSVRCWWTWQPRRLFRRWVVGSYHLEKSTLEDGVSVMAVTGMDIARRGWKRAYEVSWIGSAAEGIVCARVRYTEVVSPAVNSVSSWFTFLGWVWCVWLGHCGCWGPILWQSKQWFSQRNTSQMYRPAGEW